MAGNEFVMKISVNLQRRQIIYGLLCLILSLVILGPDVHHQRVVNQERTIKITQAKKKPVAKSSTTHHATGVMRTPINWHKSSETRPYPDLNKAKHLWVRVSLRGNRTYLYDGSKLLYTMYSTGGMYQRDPKTHQLKSMTPTGTFHVEPERGDHFFNGTLNEGANYYVSWLYHGEYLFHSVPTEANGTYNVQEAKKLGKSTGSHGCIRLSIADAQFMEHNLPVGTKVVVQN